MQFKKQMLGIVLAITISFSAPLSAMNTSKIGITESFQTMVNFLSEFGMQVGKKGIIVKETLIQEALKHPQVAKGIAGYLCLCYLRSLINKKGYNAINGKISPTEFIGDGIANIWRIPLDIVNVTRKPIHMIHENFQTGFELAIRGISYISTPLLLNAFLKSNIYKNSAFLTTVFGKEPKNNAYFTFLSMGTFVLAPLVKYVLELALLGEDPAKTEKDRQDKLFGDNKESKKKSHANFKKAEWFGDLPYQAQKFIKNLNENYENAPRTMLLNGPTGAGKTELAKVISNHFDASEENGRLCVLTGNDTIAKYGGIGNERVNNAINNIINGAKNNPNHMYCFIVDEVETMTTKRGNEKAEESGILSDKVDTSQGFRAKIDEINGDEVKNIIVIGTTNFKNKIDTAIKNQFKVQITITNPRDQERKELIKGFIGKQQKNQKKYSIDEPALNYLTTMTDGLTTRTIKDLCSEIKLITIEDNDITNISLNNTELVFEINKLVKEKLDNAFSNCSEDKDEFYQENLKIVEKTIQELEKAHFRLIVLNDLHSFKNILENNEDVSEIKETCIKNLNEYYEKLPKTSEQIFLTKQLEAIEKATEEKDIITISQSINNYFDSKTISKGSLQKQIDALNTLNEEFITLGKLFFEDNVSLIQKSCQKIKKLVYELQENCTCLIIEKTEKELENTINSLKNISKELENTDITLKTFNNSLNTTTKKLNQCISEKEALIAQKKLNKKSPILNDISEYKKKIYYNEQKISELNKQKIDQEKKLSLYTEASNNLLIKATEEKQKNLFDTIIQLTDNCDKFEYINQSKKIKETLKNLLKSKELQKQNLQKQSSSIIKIVDDSFITDGNKKQQMIQNKIKIIKDQTLTSDQYKLKNSIYKIDNEPTVNNIDETIEIIKKNSDIKIIIPKKENIVKITTRNDLEVELRAKELAEKIGTSIEETKILISLIEKQPKDITEYEVKNVYNENYESLQPSIFTKFFRMFGLLFNDYSHKNLYLALTLKKFGEQNKIENGLNTTDLVEFSSKANNLYDTYVTHGGISEEDFNIILYLKTLEAKNNKKYNEVIEKEMNIDSGKILIEDMSKNIIKKKDNKIYIKNMGQENDITENIKLLSYIHKIPDINTIKFSKNSDYLN